MVEGPHGVNWGSERGKILWYCHPRLERDPFPVILPSENSHLTVPKGLGKIIKGFYTFQGSSVPMEHVIDRGSQGLANGLEIRELSFIFSSPIYD